MVIVRRSPHRWWWVALVPIVGSLLAIADASAHESGGNGCCAVACGLAPGGSAAPSADVPVLDKGRIATNVPLTEPAAADVFGSGIASRICRSPVQLAPANHVREPFANGPHPTAPAAVRVICHPRVRITRLHNGSILCWRELRSAHVLAVPADSNDDTASDGDDTADDDDSWDDLNGDDDTESPTTAWVQVTILYLVAPECATVSSWIVPSFPPFLTSQRLRC